MGRTKRLRMKKRNQSKNSDKCDSVVSLYHYMNKFGWKNEKKLTCQNFSTTGRGLCSKTNIVPGDAIIRLPLEAMITLATLENDQHFRDLTADFANSTNTISFQSLLALYILFQKHSSDSPFKPYIDSIPSTFSTPYFCQGNELYFLPEVVLLQTVDQNRKIRESYTALQTAFGDKTCSCCGFLYFKEVFSLEEFKWAYFAVNSRSVFLNAHEIQPSSTPWCKKLLSDKPEMALAPFLDLFNHSDAALTEPLIEKEGNNLHYQLVTKNSYEAYEQIFISYGSLTNLKLFTEYGFSLENNSNDYFEITLVDIEALIRTERKFKGVFFHSNKFKFIRDHNLNDQMFIHANDGISHNLQVVLYLIFKEPSHFPNVLNQTAFGSIIGFEESIQDEARLLCLYKIKEYQGFIDGLLKLNELSCAGQASVVFLKHSVSNLQAYLDKFV